jgi:hypothetical protein
MKRRIKIFSIVFIVLVVAASSATALYLDVIAKKGIEQGSTYALGVDTSVDKVHLGLVSGNFGLSSFHIRNPEGFESEDFFVLNNARLSVGLRSVMGDTVVVNEILLDGITLNLEQVNRNSNYGVILDHVKQFEKGAKSRDREGKGSKKRFIIDELTVKNVVARVRLKSPELGINKEMTVEVPEIHLEGIGAKIGGVGLPEITSIVITRVLDAVVRSGNDLPGQLRSAIESELADLVGRQGPLAGDVKKSGRKAVEEAAGELVDDAKDRVKGLLGGSGN